MKVSEIVIATGGKLISGDENLEITGFSQDSRKVSQGMMYIPIIGERFDGHDFIDSAFDNGASAVISERMIKDSNHVVVVVENTLKALQDMARYLRTHRDVKVVGITGSVGKTSTRDMVYSVVRQQYKTLKTDGNYNNNIGLPLTILRYQDEEVMILEMGMNHLKEMEELSLIARPDISAITNVGTAHIGELGSRENILKAKMEIIAGMKDGSTLVINGDNDMLSTVKLDHLELVKVGLDSEAEFKARNVILKDNYSEFDISYGGNDYHVVVPVPGVHFVLNALVALAVGTKLNISMDKCIKGIEEFELTKKRMDVMELNDNIILIDGTYNASEDSMKSSLDVLATYNRRKVAVLADMLELGEFSEQLHRSVGKYLANKQIDLLVAVGQEARYIVAGAKEAGMDNIYYCKDNEEVVCYLKNNLQSGDVVLLKGSNGMKLKDVVAKIEEMFS